MLKANVKIPNQINYQEMKVVLIAIASFLVVGLTNSYTIPPDEVQRTPVANVSDGRLIFAHVVSFIEMNYLQLAYFNPEKCIRVRKNNEFQSISFPDVMSV